MINNYLTIIEVFTIRINIVPKAVDNKRHFSGNTAFIKLVLQPKKEAAVIER